MLLPFLDAFADARGKMRYSRVMLTGISPFIPDPALDLEGRFIWKTWSLSPNLLKAHFRET